MDAINALHFRAPQDFEDAEAIVGENSLPTEKNTEFNSESNQKFELGSELNSEFNSEPDSELNPLSSAFQRRYLMAQIGQEQFAFPLQWVGELILVESSQILALPFYDSRLLGVLQHKGDVVPLVIAPLTSQVETTAAAQRLRTKRTLTTVRLNRTAGRLAGVGLVFDRVIQHLTSTPQTECQSQVRVFQLDDVPSTIWQPL